VLFRSVVEDDDRVLAAELEVDVLEAVGAGLRDRDARLTGAGQRDDRDVRVLHDRVADLSPAPVHDVDDTRRDTRFEEQLDEALAQRGRVRGRLEDDGVPADERAEPEELLAALRSRDEAPILIRLLRGGYGAVDVLGGRLREDADRVAVRRARALEGLAGGGVDPLAGDVVLECLRAEDGHGVDSIQAPRSRGKTLAPAPAGARGSR